MNGKLYYLTDTYFEEKWKVHKNLQKAKNDPAIMLINNFKINKEADELFSVIPLESARGEEMKEVGLNLQNLKKFRLK